MVRLINTKCKRCGKPLTTLSKSIWGAEDARSKYAEICSSCMTDEETIDMQNMIRCAVQKKLGVI